jgi:LacI family transcriptional regulator
MARKTIEDVAALAGVSIKTVSRVVNKEPNVRAETRERVEAAIAELNYQPSLPARTLAARRSNLLGLVYENPSASYVFAVQSGAMAKCHELNIRLFIQSCNDLGEELIDEVLAMVDQTHVDGLVVTPPLSANHALISALDRRGLPFVRMAPDDYVDGSPTVEMDDRAAAREMTGYLADLGHRRIGFVAGHPDHYSSRIRLRGFREELQARDIPFEDRLVEQGYNNHVSGLEAARRMLADSMRPTAIFASNDDMAAGVIVAAHELDIEVPRQLSVAGFDDTEVAAIVWPTLTTIHQPVYDMAFAATGLLAELVKGGETPPITWLDYRIVERGSTAPPPP